MEGMGITYGKETKEAEPLPMGPHHPIEPTATHTFAPLDHGRQIPSCPRTFCSCPAPKVPARGNPAASFASLEVGRRVALAPGWAASGGGWWEA